MRHLGRSSGLLAVAALVGGLMAGIAGTAPPAVAAPSCTGTITITCTFSFTGSPEDFTVPDGVISVTVDALGAAGGPSQEGDFGVGRGAEAKATIAVTPHETLQVNVGGSPPAGNPATGGFNGGGAGGTASNGSPNVGGGGGGGASDVRQGGFDLAHRVVVAGGGGGAGVWTAGPVSDSCTGGWGGGTYGSDAGPCGGAGGLGATPSAGGSANTGGSPGTGGTSGTGGNGGSIDGPGGQLLGGGGGGGGGFFGGGGGSGREGTSGGGGGGSGFTPSRTGMTQGALPWGNGQVTLSYTNPPPGTSVVSSQQFGIPDQTDVFSLAGDGSVQVRWVQGSGQWNGPLTISRPGLASPGARLAVSNQFGIPNQTDVFVVDKSGTVDVVWVDGAGTWNGPLAISPPGLASPGSRNRLAVSNQFGIPNQTDVFVVDKTGTLDVLWTEREGQWNRPLSISPVGLAPAGAALAVSNQYGMPNQTDVFVVDKTGTLGVLWVEGAGQWNGPLAIGPNPGLAPEGAGLSASNQSGTPNQTDVFVVDTEGAIDVLTVQGAGTWHGARFISPTGFAPPGAELSSSNQFGIPNQTDVFVTDDTGTLEVLWGPPSSPPPGENGLRWNGPLRISPIGLAVAGAPLVSGNQFGIPSQTDVWVVDRSGNVQVVWVDNAGGWNGPVGI